MSDIQAIELDDGSFIFVEVDDVDFQMPSVVTKKSNEDLPEGAELTSAVGDAIDTMKTLKNTISSLLNTIHAGIKENAPDEWGVELSVGFKGNATVPVLLKSESNVAIKIHAKWIKPKN